MATTPNNKITPQVINNLIALHTEDLEENENQTLIIVTFTKVPNTTFLRQHYPILREELREDFLDQIESTYQEEINGKDLIDIKTVVTPSTGIIKVTYIYE